MVSHDSEIAVIGAGPSGLIAAREASGKGVKVIVLEEHEEVGLPCHCAGLLSINGLRSIGVPVNGAYVLNKIRGARFFSPSNLSFTLEWNEPIACVVNRHIFDLFLAEQASKSGSFLRLKSKVTCAKREEGRWVLTINDREMMRTKILIDAEGATPIIPSLTGIKTLERRKLFKGLQVDLYGLELDPDFIEVHLSKDLAPDFFAWIIPLNEESARVGLASKSSDLRSRLFKFIGKRFKAEHSGNLRALRYYSGLVITCGPIKRTYGDGLLIVGDSAGQTKPITGGGVIFGGICAKIAGRVASEAVINNRVEKGFLKIYEDEWRSRIGREIKMAVFTRKILERLSDRDLDKIFSIIIKEGISREIAEKGDMDFQATTIARVAGVRILRFLPVIFKSFIFSIMSELRNKNI